MGALARAVRGLLAATTVNVSGDAGPDDRGPAITLAEVEEFLTGAGLDAVVMDGGVCPAANHLTIVDCASDPTSSAPDSSTRGPSPPSSAGPCRLRDRSAPRAPPTGEAPVSA